MFERLAQASGKWEPSMQFFTKIDDALALTVQNGTYKQAEVYTRNTFVFVKHGSGFARVAPKISDRYPTSVPNLRVEEFDLPPLSSLHTEGHRLVIRVRT